MKATVTSKGAVLLGKYLACDAFSDCMPLRVVTHAHADHMMGLRQSLKTCERVLMTPATKDLIDVLRGPLFLMGGHVESLKYGQPLQYEEEEITFFKADHIIGSAQVLVEDAEGTRIVFTGDFRINETPVLPADILVMEATYGSPSCRRSFNSDVQGLLVSLVEEELEHGTVYIFGYHGKIQEVMQILRNAGVKAPFVVPERVFHVSKICEMHGMRIGRLILLNEEEAKELTEGDSPCIAFHHMSFRNEVGLGCFRVYVSGWQFSSPCRQVAKNKYVVALSDHSDFDGLVEYVRLSKPKLVITDSSRVGHAERLAKEIRRRFAVSSLALPRK